jgi:hypothetical protein
LGCSLFASYDPSQLHTTPCIRAFFIAYKRTKKPAKHREKTAEKWGNRWGNAAPYKVHKSFKFKGMHQLKANHKPAF